MKKVPQVFVGVDVAKKHLDVHIYPVKRDVRVANSHEGIEKLITILSKYAVEQIVLEPTGGYEQLLARELQAAGYAVWMVNPQRIRAFIVSEGIHAKTDKIDAQMIALFASKKQNTRNCFFEANNDSNLRLRALMRRRMDLVTMLSMEKLRVQHPSQELCEEMIQVHIEFLQDQINSLEEEIEEIISETDELKHRRELLTSTPGIGNGVANLLVAEMPELGKVSNKQIAALLGVAPMIRQSGLSKGKASIRGGRHAIRQPFYMAALSATVHNKKLRSFYQGLKKRGKKGRVALVAVMRKLIVILNIMVSKGEMWNAELC